MSFLEPHVGKICRFENCLLGTLGRTISIKTLEGKVRFTGQNGQSHNSKAKLNEVPISSETNDNIHALSKHAKICSA